MKGVFYLQLEDPTTLARWIRLMILLMLVVGSASKHLLTMLLMSYICVFSDMNRSSVTDETKSKGIPPIPMFFSYSVECLGSITNRQSGVSGSEVLYSVQA